MSRKFNRLIGITISKNYSVELSMMLEKNLRHFDKWFIITQEDDVETVELIKSHNSDKIELVYYPLVPANVEPHHAPTRLHEDDLGLC